eukprot:jgi/Tetstr1/457466/TSEL_044049.t1
MSTTEVIRRNAEKLQLLQAERQALAVQLQTERKYFENERLILQEQLQFTQRTIYERPTPPSAETTPPEGEKLSRQGSAIPSYALRPPQSGAERRSLNSAHAKDGEPPPPPGSHPGPPSRLGRRPDSQHGQMTVVNLGTMPPSAASPAPPASSRGNRPSRTGYRRTPSNRSSRAPSRAGGRRTPMRALSRQGSAAAMRPAHAQYTKPRATFHTSEVLTLEPPPQQPPAEKTSASGRIVRKGRDAPVKTREGTSALWNTRPPKPLAAVQEATTAADALSSAIAQRMALRRRMAASQAEAAAATEATEQAAATAGLRKGSKDGVDSRPASSAPRLLGKDFKAQAREAKQLLERVEPVVLGRCEGTLAAGAPEDKTNQLDLAAALEGGSSSEALPAGEPLLAPQRREPPRLQQVPALASVSAEEMAARVAALPIPSIGGMQLHPASSTLPDGGIFRASKEPASGHADPRVRRRRARGHEPSRRTSDDGSKQGGDESTHYSVEPGTAIQWHVQELPPLPTIPDDLDLSQMDPAEAEESIMALSKQLKSAIQEQRSVADEIITAEREELQQMARIHRHRMEMELAELQAANMEIEEEEEEASGPLSQSSLQIQVALEAMKQQMAEMQALQESLMERMAATEEEGGKPDFTESMQQTAAQHEEQIVAMLEECDALDERIIQQGGAGAPHDISASLVQPADGVIYADPTDEEIDEYAVYLGIDPCAEQDLLWIARQAITAPVPEGWERYLDAEGNEFYYDRAKHFSTYEHPLDERFRGMVTMAKSQSAVQLHLPPAAST